jgi:hypothetical protein
MKVVRVLGVLLSFDSARKLRPISDEYRDHASLLMQGVLPDVQGMYREVLNFGPHSNTEPDERRWNRVDPRLDFWRLMPRSLCDVIMFLRVERLMDVLRVHTHRHTHTYQKSENF